MCAALAKYGVDYTILRWIWATLEVQLDAATLGGLPRSVGVSRCYPLGGVFSLLLRCLAVNELLESLNEGDIFSQWRTDDICLLAVGKFSNTLSGLIQFALHTVGVWCNELGLSVHLNKNGLVAFTRRRKLPGLFEPRLCGTTLYRSNSVMYQGVMLGSQMTWREHLDIKVRKAENLF